MVSRLRSPYVVVSSRPRHGKLTKIETVSNLCTLTDLCTLTGQRRNRPQLTRQLRVGADLTAASTRHLRYLQPRSRCARTFCSIHAVTPLHKVHIDATFHCGTLSSVVRCMQHSLAVLRTTDLYMVYIVANYAGWQITLERALRLFGLCWFWMFPSPTSFQRRWTFPVAGALTIV